MRKFQIVTLFCSFISIAACLNQKASLKITANDKPLFIPPSEQVTGNADSGYQYLVTGDYLKSGFPYATFKKLSGKKKVNDLGRTGVNENIPYDFTAIKASNGVMVVAPNCLQCHAQVMDGKVVTGLGNSLADFSMPMYATSIIAEKIAMAGASEKEKAAAANLFTSMKSIAPYLVAASKGVNVADRLTAVLASYRDPATFKWMEKQKLKIPETVLPTDVPAWWLLKKKNGMFYNGFGRGDFSRFLMASNLLTVTDTAESTEVFSHFHHVLSYIYSIEPPKYPAAINQQLAQSGKLLFERDCSTCHGTYGANFTYPNLLIPGNIIKTDSLLYASNFSSPQFLEWFKRSWFRTGERKADLVPFAGYIAPPLDGIWITAPYLHNGSIPTLEAVLNSKARPTFWARDFNKPVYDTLNPGWRHTSSDKQYTRSTYNTTLAGYGNKGHYFGDKLTAAEREAVIEYLKTL